MMKGRFLNLRTLRFSYNLVHRVLKPNSPALFARQSVTNTVYDTDAEANVVDVKPEQMTSLEDWQDDSQSELMFVTKSGLPLPFFPITHSAVALHHTMRDTFAVYGRQSPWDFSSWIRDGIRFDTRVDNERHYLAKGYNFTAYPTGVYLNKLQAEYCLQAADELINATQTCNMVTSNCYSYSTVVMAYALEAQLRKPDLNMAAIRNIMTVMEDHPLTDHFAVGVTNNDKVSAKLLTVFSSVYARVQDGPATQEVEEAKSQAERLIRMVR